MNPQELKQGHEYLIRAKFDHKDYDNDYNFIADPSEYRIFLDEKSVRQSVIETLEAPTSAGSQPKNDPCRLFRKGDRVRVITWNGRSPFDTIHGLKINPGEVHIVLDDEYERNEVYIGMSAADEEQSVVHACNLELITPIEELEPYEVTESTDYFAVENRSKGDEAATFWKEWHPNPKEAAEAECARLNAEHRKEKQ